VLWYVIVVCGASINRLLFVAWRLVARRDDNRVIYVFRVHSDSRFSSLGLLTIALFFYMFEITVRDGGRQAHICAKQATL